MSQFSGPQGKGAMKLRREKKREEAKLRDTFTKPERRSKKGQKNGR